MNIIKFFYSSARAGKEPRSQYQKSWLSNQTHWSEHKTHWLCSLITATCPFQWDIKPRVLLGGGQWGVVTLALEAVTHLCLLGQSSWFPELPWAVSAAPGSRAGAGTSLGRVVASSPTVGAQQASGSCLLCVSAGFCGRKLVLG